VQWAAALPSDVELWAAQLPGRGPRFREKLADGVDELLEGLFPAVGAMVDLPYVLFGHSMGAMLAFELARRARREQATAPRYLFVSGRVAPGRPRAKAMHALPDDQFVEELRRLGGMPEELLRDPKVLELFSPMLRADMRIAETWCYPSEPPLSVAIAAFGGLADAGVRHADLEAWRDQTTGSFSTHLFPGGHFFLQSARAALIAVLTRLMTTVSPSATSSA
jgi:medium-chain acyl-[acyl-carrier-protein] hydrolase